MRVTAGGPPSRPVHQRPPEAASLLEALAEQVRVIEKKASRPVRSSACGGGIGAHSHSGRRQSAFTSPLAFTSKVLFLSALPLSFTATLGPSGEDKGAGSSREACSCSPRTRTRLASSSTVSSPPTGKCVRSEMAPPTSTVSRMLLPAPRANEPAGSCRASDSIRGGNRKG